jgi:hypothetical protein
MPGALVEPLYLTNPDDARLLGDGRVLEGLAQGYADALAAFLGPPTRRAIVTGPIGANLRPAPLLAAPPSVLLPKGAALELAERVSGDAVSGRSDWWRVDWKGQAGFVFGRLVGPALSSAPSTTPTAAPGAAATPSPVAPTPAPASPTPSPAAPTRTPAAATPSPSPLPSGTASPSRRVTVRDDGDGLRVRIHTEPNRGAPILVRASPGERLDVLAAADGEVVDGHGSVWLKVRRNTTVGWLWGPLTDPTD